MAEDRIADGPSQREPFVDPKTGKLSNYGHKWTHKLFWRTGGYEDWIARSLAVGAVSLSQVNTVAREAAGARQDAVRAQGQVSALLGDPRLKAVPEIQSQIGSLLAQVAAAKGDKRLDAALQALDLAATALAVCQSGLERAQHRIGRLEGLVGSLGGRTTRAQQSLEGLTRRVTEEAAATSRYQAFVYQSYAVQAQDAAREQQELADQVAGLTTDDIAEGSTNQYYTDERVDDRAAALIQNGTGIGWTYDDGAGTLTPAVTLAPFDTGDLSEGSNLYHTDARARSAVVGAVLPGDLELKTSPGGNRQIRIWSNSGWYHDLAASGDDFIIFDAAGNVRFRIRYSLGGNIMLPQYGAGNLVTDASGNVTASAGLEGATLRVNESVTAAAVAQTHHIPINVGGVTYKLLLAN